MIRRSVRASVMLALFTTHAIGHAVSPSPPSLASARQALASGDAAGAVVMYEALTQQGESLEAELGLVRAALQAGEFRKAMSWATLTAGEHKDSAESIALLAYLQDRVGHTEQATALVNEWLAMNPRQEKGVLTSSWPRPSFESFPLGERRVAGAGNGLIVDDGKHVLTYAGLLPEGAAIYVRNGLGKLRRAERVAGDQKGQLVRLRLVEAYPAAQSFPAEQIASPEGVRFCFTFGYSAPRNPEGTFPAVAPGLVFRADVGVGDLMQVTNALGAGHAGSPVLDPRGRLIGIAVGAGDIIVDGENIRPRVGAGHFAVRVALPATVTEKTSQRPAGPQPPMPAIEELYERLLPSLVQVVAVQ